MNQKEGCFKFHKQSKDKSRWIEWTGGFDTEAQAKEWLNSPSRGQYFTDKGYTFGLFLNASRIFPKWM